MAANPNHTPPRSIRVPNQLWRDAQIAASDRDETVTDAILRMLDTYVQDTPRARERARLAKAKDTGDYVESWHCDQPAQYRVVCDSWDLDVEPPVRHIYEVEAIDVLDEATA